MISNQPGRARETLRPRRLGLCLVWIWAWCLVAVPTRADDLVDLLAQHKVQVEVTGTDIQQVVLRIRRLGTQPVQVDIQAGTFFESGNRSAQNMVGTASRTIQLASQDWVTLTLPAACANRPRNIPTSADRFSVKRLPQQAELAAAARALSATGAAYAVIQAAIWIVSDNANYDDMGELVETYGASAVGGTRVIREAEAARAMQILDGAGINVRKKRIWADRKQLAAHVRDSALADWLRSK